MNVKILPDSNQAIQGILHTLWFKFHIDTF
jgi:hypothetical protein